MYLSSENVTWSWTYAYILQGTCPFSQLSLPATGGDVEWEGSSGIPCGWLSSWAEDQNLALAYVRFEMSVKLYMGLSRWQLEEDDGLQRRDLGWE